MKDFSFVGRAGTYEEIANAKGTTDAAGRCVITTASQDGYNYMLIVMNAPQYDIDKDGVEENVAFWSKFDSAYHYQRLL